MVFLMKKFIAMIIIIILVFALMYIIFSDEPPEDNNNPQTGWIDLSNFRKQLYDLTIDYTLEYKKTSDPQLINSIKDPENSLLIIIGFDENITESELSAITNFVSNGGKVIIADDHGYANQISVPYGVEYKTYPLIANYYDNSSIFIPLTINLDGEEYNVITNEPIGLEVQEQSSIKIIGESKYSKAERNYSALDVNPNNLIDGNDIQGPIPVAVEYTDQNSGGKILFFSNTGMFTDKQWEITSVDPKYKGITYENSEFVKALIPHLLPDGSGTIIYDESKQTQDFSGHIYVYS